MAKILLAEDDVAVGETIVQWLTREKYFVDWERDGDMALNLLKSFEYDVVLLDWHLPSLTGPEICQAYRERGGKAPVIFLTERKSIADKEVGFSAGADDYLPKPFALKELSLRLRALLRRPHDLVDAVIVKGIYKLNAGEHQFFAEGKEIKLSPIEFALMEFFMKNENTVFSTESLLDRVWAGSSTRSPENVRTCLKRLREKIDIDPKQSYIQSVYGVGYKFGVPKEES